MMNIVIIYENKLTHCVTPYKNKLKHLVPHVLQKLGCSVVKVYKSIQRELSNKYQHDRVYMVFKNLCVLVHWMKVASALIVFSMSEFCYLMGNSCQIKIFVYARKLLPVKYVTTNNVWKWIQLSCGIHFLFIQWKTINVLQDVNVYLCYNFCSLMPVYVWMKNIKFSLKVMFI